MSIQGRGLIRAARDFRNQASIAVHRFQFGNHIRPISDIWADLVLLTLYGGVAGTIRAAARQLVKQGQKVGVLSIKLYRPFPTQLVADLLKEAKVVGVMDRSISFGAPFSPLSQDVRSVLSSLDIGAKVVSVNYGIGGRDFSVDDGREVFSLLKRREVQTSETYHYGAR